MKKRLTEIADDFGISFDEALDIAFKNLAEDMLSGKGKNTWITEIANIHTYMDMLNHPKDE